MHEALRRIRGTVPWLTPSESEAPTAPAQPTSLELAEGLVLLAKSPGQIDRASPTWSGIARWVATELILVHLGLETATDAKAAALRSRAKTLRDLLDVNERAESKVTIEDEGPHIP